MELERNGRHEKERGHLAAAAATTMSTLGMRVPLKSNNEEEGVNGKKKKEYRRR